MVKFRKWWLLIFDMLANEAQSTQDVGRDAFLNSNVFPLMLLVCSVDTLIHINRPHLLASHCALHPVSCVVWALVCVCV